jgi:hypothetical protein
MVTLHIEHSITDLPTWRAAFDRFATRRAQAGVSAHRIQQPSDDPNWIVIQLDFPTIEQAKSFQKFLESTVWNNPENAPALGSAPRSRVLVDAPTS